VAYSINRIWLRRPGPNKVSSFSVPGSCTATRRSGVLAPRDGHYSGLQHRGTRVVHGGVSTPQHLGLAGFGFGVIPSCGWPGVAVYCVLVRSLVLRKQGRKCAYLPCTLDLASNALTDKQQRIFGRQIDHKLHPSRLIGRSPARIPPTDTPSGFTGAHRLICS
jgi:hypothetical protein